MSRNTKIFLIVFTVVLVAITILAIVYKKSQKDVSDESRIIIESGQKVPEFAILIKMDKILLLREQH